MSSGAIRYGENNFVTKDGLKLFYRYWKPSDESKSLIIGVHGYAEHSGRYKHVGEFFASNGFAFYMHDLRGHGKSDGERGHVDSFWDFISDLDQFINHVKDIEKEEKIFLLGHSMGGLISIIYAIENHSTLSGLITSGAALRTSIKIGKIQEVLMKTISKVRPKYRPEIAVDPNLLTHDPEVNKAYAEDPLVFKQGTVRLLTEMTKAMDWAWMNADKLNVPILMLHGSDDKIVPVEASKDFFDLIKVADKELKIFNGMYHEILNEKEKEKVLSTILKWINRHL